jgi:hypothetical protein
MQVASRRQREPRKAGAVALRLVIPAIVLQIRHGLRDLSACTGDRKSKKTCDQGLFDELHLAAMLAIALLAKA